MRSVKLLTTGSVITPPSLPAVSLAFAKKHIRALGDFDDNLIEMWVQGATQVFEEYTGRQVITAIREVWLDRFPYTYYAWHGTQQVLQPAAIELPFPPLQSVVSITYVDGDGATQTVDSANYRIENPSGPQCDRGWVEPVGGYEWPATAVQRASVRVQFECGYGDTEDDVPEMIKGCLLFLVANYDQYRVASEDIRGTMQEVDFGPTTIMAPFKSIPRVTMR